MRKSKPQPAAPAPKPVTPAPVEVKPPPLVVFPSMEDPTPSESNERFYDSRGLFLINRPALELCKHFEGAHMTAYLDPVKVPTIGWGHIKTVTHADVKAKKTISVAEGERLLMADLYDEGAKYVRAYLKHENRLNENQFSALVDLTFNRGAGRFNDQMDDVVDAALEDGFLSKGDFEAIAKRLNYYNFAISGGQRKILEGLSRRRAAEHLLFLGLDWKAVSSVKTWKANYAAALKKAGY